MFRSRPSGSPSRFDRRIDPRAWRFKNRYGRRSTIITSQLPVAAWHTVIGEATYDDAILDRVVPNAHRLDLSDASLRRLAPKPVGLP